MSYFRKPSRGNGSQPALGDIASIVNAVGIAADLSADPYLSETVCRVSQLRELNANRKPGACVTTKSGLPGGVGLRKLVPPLRAYVYAEQHKWAYAAAAALVIGLPMLIGYSLGKGGR